MAEIAGLALGVVGLVGIYSTALQLLDQVTTARHLGAEIQQHQTKLNTVKTSLRLWGERTGINTENGNLDGRRRHHPVFDDVETREQVAATLACLQDVLEEVDVELKGYQQLGQAAKPASADVVVMRRWFRGAVKAVQKSTAMGKKVGWGAGDGKKMKEAVENLRGLVGLLYEIAPPEEMNAREREAQIGVLMERNRDILLKTARTLAEVKEVELRQAQVALWRDIDNWLAPNDCTVVFRRSVEKAHPGTCAWIHQLEVVKAWEGSEKPSAQFVWLYSKHPGVGKTVAASKLIEYLQRTSPYPLVYYFITHDATANHGAEMVVRSIIHQLITSHGHSGFDIVTAAYSTARKGGNIDYWDILQNVLKANPNTRLVLDGLDEMSDDSDKYGTNSKARFLKKLKCVSIETGLRVLITSRYESEIETALKAAEDSSKYHFQIGIKQTKPDIETVARDYVNVKLIKKEKKDRDGITTAIVNKADEMFMILEALLPGIKDDMFVGDIYQHIEHGLSSNTNVNGLVLLNEAYGRQLEKILRLPSGSRDLCLSVLLWLQFSARQLTVGELLNILPIRVRTDIDRYSFPQIVTKNDIHLHILQHCRTLVEFHCETADFKKGTLRLSHFSVKEFLQSTLLLSADPRWRFLQNPSLANAHLAKLCLEYILRETVFSRYPTKTEKGKWICDVKFLEKLATEHPFYDYAAHFWVRHVDLSAKNQVVVRMMDRGLSLGGKDKEDMVQLLKNFTDFTELLRTDAGNHETSELMTADPQLAELCLLFMDLDGNQGSYKVWIHYLHGFFMTPAGNSLSTSKLAGPFLRAVHWDHWHSGQFGTTYGRDFRKTRLHRRLFDMMLVGSVSSIIMLIDKGADLNYMWPDHMSSCHSFGLWRRHLGTTTSTYVITLFLSSRFKGKMDLPLPPYPVDVVVNGTVIRVGGRGRFTIQRLGHLLFGNQIQRIVGGIRGDEDEELGQITMLLNLGIDVNNRSILYPSAIQSAVLLRHTKALQKLLNSGADANMSTYLRPTSTFVADSSLVRESLWEMLQEIMPNFGSFYQEGRPFGNLLRIVERNVNFEWDRKKIIAALLDPDSLRRNSAGWVNEEKLQLAVRRGDVKAATSMIKSKGPAYVNHVGKWYGSALYVACYFGMEEMVDLLLKHGADPDLAVHSKILELEQEVEFVWAGLWRKSLSKSGAANTPLQAAARNQHIQILRKLLTAKVDINKDSSSTGTALYHATMGSYIKDENIEWMYARLVRQDEEKASPDAEGSSKPDPRFSNLFGINSPKYHRESLIRETEKNNKFRATSLELIKLLLSSGASPNIYGGELHSPLQAAAFAGREDIVQLLLTNRNTPATASPPIGGRYGSPLQAAIIAHPDNNTAEIKEGYECGLSIEISKYRALSLIFLHPIYFILLIWGWGAYNPFGEWGTLERAQSAPPGDRGGKIIGKLILSGAEPMRIGEGPWNSPLQAACFFGSVQTLVWMLHRDDSPAEGRQKALHAVGGRAGSVFNAIRMNGRIDMLDILWYLEPNAGINWSSLLYLRARKILTGMEARLIWVLEWLWWLSGPILLFLVFGGIGLVLAEVEEKAREIDAWMVSRDVDFRIRAAWKVFAGLGVGYWVTLRNEWMEGDQNPVGTVYM